MPQPNAHDATVTAAEFLTRCFAPGETIALFLRREVPRATVQRIVLLETALAPRYLAWLAHENVAGANVYVAANPLRSDSRKRTKECIAILTAQEAIHLVSQHVGVAIVTKPASVGASVEGVVIRPLSDPSLSFETCLIMRADEDSRLANDFGRSFLRNCAPRRPPPMQLTLPLPA